MAGKMDENLVIFFKGKYYMVTKDKWLTGNKPLSPTSSQFAESVIDSGGLVGYVPDKVHGNMPGAYSTVVNLSAILKGAK